MRWNLRLAAANRGIWKASDLQRMLAEHGLVISAGKMSGLWSGQPASINLDDDSGTLFEHHSDTFFQHHPHTCSSIDRGACIKKIGTFFRHHQAGGREADS